MGIAASNVPVPEIPEDGLEVAAVAVKGKR
jgi:hypothetical protein